jgi:hypothetical protein
MPEYLSHRARPRRAYKRWWWPRWLQFVLVGLIMLLVGTVTGTLAMAESSPPVASVAPVPAPTSTYTSFVPEMPWECTDMLERGDTLYDASTTWEQDTLKAVQLTLAGLKSKKPDQLLEAGRQYEKAEKFTKSFSAARLAFIKQFEKCRDA